MNKAEYTRVQIDRGILLLESDELQVSDRMINLMYQELKDICEYLGISFESLTREINFQRTKKNVGDACAYMTETIKNTYTVNSLYNLTDVDSVASSMLRDGKNLYLSVFTIHSVELENKVKVEPDTESFETYIELNKESMLKLYYNARYNLINIQ